jgi:hypothetical protein
MEDETMVYANLAGYLMVAAGGLVLGTLFGSKLTSALMTSIHALESRISTVEGAALAHHTTVAAGSHAAAIQSHAVAVSRLAGAIEKHAAAVDEHGAATVAAAVETHTAALAVTK